jgi:hypothetical protein
MNKVLYISSKNIQDSTVGGSQCAFRNYQAVCSYFGKENVRFLQIVFRKRFRFLHLFNKREIIKNAKDMQVIFIESSIFGSLAKRIKKINKKARIITFFQNVEYDYFREEYSRKIIRKIIIRKIIFKNETLTCAYSDIIVSLNFRDSRRIEELYGRKPDAVIPISFSDRDIKFSEKKIGIPPTALFLGSDFFANTHGILWFVKNVLPFVNMLLQIIGKDMNKVNFPHSDKLEMLGCVDDLEPYMQNADFMIYPVFKGSGMKVKTCEALMHGKNIIGTSEVFEGYDVDFEKVGACCETAEEFIEAINEFFGRFTHKFNEYSRNVFLKKYSNDVTFEQFANLFGRLI